MVFAVVLVAELCVGAYILVVIERWSKRRALEARRKELLREHPPGGGAASSPDASHFQQPCRTGNQSDKFSKFTGLIAPEWQLITSPAHGIHLRATSLPSKTGWIPTMVLVTRRNPANPLATTTNPITERE
jgi:hypothetical protein